MAFVWAEKNKSANKLTFEEELNKKYLASIHNHTDKFPEAINRQGKNERHGALPKNLAKNFVENEINSFAITDHIKAVQVDLEGSFQRFMEACQEVDRIKGDKEIIGRYGIELSMTSPRINDPIEDEPCKYHIGLIFENDFQSSNDLPDLTSLHHLADFENYLKFREVHGKAYPHIAILNHPSTENFSYELKGCEKTTEMIMQFVDGIEVANRRAFGKVVLPTKLFVNDILLALDAKQKNPELALIGSGDIHNGESECVSTFATSFYANKPIGLFEAVRNGNTRVDIIESPHDEVNQRVIEIVEEINRQVREGLIDINKTGKLSKYCSINSQHLDIGNHPINHF